MIAATATMQSAFAAALLDPDVSVPSGVRSPRDADPRSRFAIHRNNVVGSLIDALADTFPITQELVGTEFFRAMGSIFVRQSPPLSPVLALYGADLPAFIDGFEPARSLPYLADVARLEHARVVACHAADREPLSTEEALRILGTGEHADDLQMGLHPSLVAFETDHAAVSIWAAHQGDDVPGGFETARTEACLIVRDGLDVIVAPVPLGVTTFTRSIACGVPLGRAVAKASVVDPGFDVTATLQLLMRHGGLVSLRVGADTAP